MANAKICDRCGVFYRPETTMDYKYTVTTKYDLIGDAFDLCEKCSESLDAWVVDGKEQEDGNDPR